MVGPASTGRARQAFAVVNNKPDGTVTNDMGSAEGSDCAPVEFTKEKIEALLNEKSKGKKFDHKVMLIFVNVKLCFVQILCGFLL